MNLVNNITPRKASDLTCQILSQTLKEAIAVKDGYLKFLEIKDNIWENWHKIMNQKLVPEMLFNPLEITSNVMAINPEASQEYITDLQRREKEYHKAQEVKLFDNWEKVKSANHSHHYSNGIVNIIFNVETDGPIKLFCNKKNKGIITTPQHLLQEADKYNDGIEKPDFKRYEELEASWAFIEQDKKRELQVYKSKLIQIPWSKALIKRLT